MKAIAVLALCVLAVNAFTEQIYQNEWSAFKTRFGKTYSAVEETTRYGIFKANYDFIVKFNSEEHSHKVAVNQFADLTNEEFRAIYLSPYPLTGSVSVPEDNSTVGALPTSWNWVSKGAVTAVKNQGQCGSCWSFSTTGSVEGCHFITTGKLVALSEQNLMDCSTAEGNQGCNGGLMDDAFEYIIKNKGIDTEASYPYTAQDGTCHYKAADCGSTVGAYTDVKSGSEADLQTAVHLTPVSIAIDASQSSFQFYSSGVYYEPACSSTQLDHGVLAVGWGVDGTKPYWIVKNSWGTDWGLKGYIWMSRNRNNNCGVATMASYPTKCGTCA